MASTYSSNLKIELMITGENSGTWGTITNTNLGTALEQAVVGLGNPDFVADANLTITLTDNNTAQAARALVLNVTSTFGSLSTTRELIVPTIQKQYIVQNNTTGGQSITVKTSSGTGITVPNGKKMHLYVDGVNVVDAVSHFSSLTLASALPVLSGGTGVITSTGTTNVVLSNSPTLVAPALGTPASGVVTNLTGTASININGTVGATTANTGAFTTLTSSSTTTLNGTTVPASVTLVSTAASQTLTNKTINASNNTLTNVSLTTAVTGTLPIANGGTGQTTANAALNALLPSQTGNNGKALTTDGTSTAFTALFAGGLTQIEVVAALPGSPNATTLYIVTP